MRLTFSLLALAIFCLTIGCKGNKSGTTSQGYKYVKHKSGNGKRPTKGDMAKIQYDVYQDSILVFSTQRDQGGPQMFPITDPANVSIKQRPISDGLLLMAVGDSISVFWDVDTVTSIPQLADAKLLRFDIVLVELQDSASFAKKEAVMRGKEQELIAVMGGIISDSSKYQRRVKPIADSMKIIIPAMVAGSAAGLKTTASGIKYVITRQGTGKPAGPNSIGIIHYYGTLTDGKTKFDESFSRGEPFPLQIGAGGVIKGWDELLEDVLPEGCSAYVVIPSELAYGANPRPGGPIKPGDDLAFFMEPLVYEEDFTK